MSSAIENYNFDFLNQSYVFLMSEQFVGLQKFIEPQELILRSRIFTLQRTVIAAMISKIICEISHAVITVITDLKKRFCSAQFKIYYLMMDES